MFRNLLKKIEKLPASVTLTAFILGAMGIVGAAVLLVRHGSGSDVEANNLPPFAARLDRLDGEVAVASPTGTSDQSYSEWTRATSNLPISTGDRVYVKERSRAAIAFSGRNYARLNPQTSLDILSLNERRTQLALRDGSCVFDVGALASDELFEIATPNGAVDFVEPGLYQVGIDDGGNTLISVLNGVAQVVGLAGSGRITRGELLTLAAATAAQAYSSHLSPDVAGNIVDDYYSYRYPDIYDGRYIDYDTYLEDPYFDDPYRRSASYTYIPDDADVAGLEDLDYYGDWSDLPEYGHCWRPRTSAGWAPYRDGYWSNDYPLGLTWVSNERWGWAPYHYGRWAFVNSDWYWVPGEVATRPVYSPALVAFVPLPEPDRVGWCPLGPGDQYVPHYYDSGYRPRYIGSTTVVNNYTSVTNIVNYSVPGAVTVVPASRLTRVITPNSVWTADPAMLSRTRPVVDPFTVPALRQVAANLETARPATQMPAELRSRLARPVLASQQPVVPTMSVDAVRSLRVEPVPESRAKSKLQINNSGQTVAVRKANGLPLAPVPPQSQVSQQPGQPSQPVNESPAAAERRARIAVLSSQAAQGDKSARRELRQIEEQQRVQEKLDRKSAVQQQIAQQAQERRAQKQAASQQAQQAEQQRQAQVTQQAEQRRAQKQAARQQAQIEQQRQAQVTQQAEQRQAQKQAARQQAQIEQQRQAEVIQQAEQRRAQKQAARQQSQQIDQQRQAQQAQQQQQKADRRAQSQAAPQNQSQSQTKAERKAERARNKNRNPDQF